MPELKDMFASERRKVGDVCVVGGLTVVALWAGTCLEAVTNIIRRQRTFQTVILPASNQWPPDGR